MCEKKGLALARLTAVPAASDAGAPPLAKSLANLLAAKTFTDDVFLKAVALLHAHGMDLEPKRKALLPFAATRCSVRLVKGLLDLGADPAGLYFSSNASARAEKCPENEKQTIQAELLKQRTRTVDA